MNSFIVFETNLPANDTDLTAGLLKAGYHQAWLSDKKVRYDLPSNCVWKPGIELEAALKEIESITANLNLQRTAAIVLKKCIVLSNTPWVGIPTP